MQYNINQLNVEENPSFQKLGTAKYQKANEIFNEIKRVFSEYYNSGNKLLADNQTLNIGVVGQVKAGKSSFLNSLIFNGENVLPQASTPMTAGLTVLKYNEESFFEIEYYNADEWSVFVTGAKQYDEQVAEYKAQNPDFANLAHEEIAKMIPISDEICSSKELLERCGDAAKRKIKEKSNVERVDFSSIDGLQEKLNEYVGADGAYTSVVKNLTVHLNDKRLEGMQIVDTPGVNDPIVSRENRTREYLQSCHGVFLLSYSGRFFDATDNNFLNERIGSQGIGEVVVLASKYDSVLQDEGSKFHDDLVFADRQIQQKLREKLYRDISESNYKGKDPKFTFTSGIGYSIVQKSEDRWTPIEQKVVEQMQRFYPSYFTEKEARNETFMELANIDPIRNEYLEGLFMKNKDQIIQNKIEDFFRNVKTNVNEKLDKYLQNLSEEKISLEKENINSLTERKNQQERLIDSIQGDVQYAVRNFNNELEIAIRKIVSEKNITLSRIPTKKSQSVKLKGNNWFGIGGEDFAYDVVDSAELKRVLEEKVIKYLAGVRQAWADNIEKQRDQFVNNIHNNISDFCSKQKNIDANFYYRIVRDVASDLNVSSSIDTSKIGDHFMSIIIDIADSQSNFFNASGKKVNDKPAIRQKADAIISGVQSKIQQQIFVPIKNDIENLMQTEQNNIQNNVQGLRNDFISNLDASIRAEIEKFEKDILDKEQKMNNLTEIIEILTQLKMN